MSEVQSNTEKKSLKRKKKRSAAQMSKKFARRRGQGQGSELETESYRHMVHIMEVIRTEFPTMEDKESFADNIIEDTKNHEVDYARNQVASCVLEALIPFASYETVKSLSNAFSSSLRPMCSDKFASHVLQNIILVCLNRGNLKDKDPGTIGKKDENFNEIGLKLIKYVINNLEEFVWDSYANYIARTALESLGGLLEIPSQGKKVGPNFENRKKVKKEFRKLLFDTCTRIKNWPQFHEFGHEELTSGFLQSMMYSLKNLNDELNDEIVNTIIEKNFTKNTDTELSNIFDSESSVRLLEVCLMVCGSEQFSKIYETFFVNKLKHLSLTKSTNFSVQKLMDHCTEKDVFEKIFDEIVDHLEDILRTGHTGVIASLANACLRLKAKQGPFVNILCKILQCSETEEKMLRLVPLVSGLRTYEQHNRMKKENDKLPLHLHGSLIVQAMLNFNKPIKVVNSMISMENEELIAMLGDPKGSRILDAYMDSTFVGEKSREKLMRKLKGFWVDLANCIHGSRCLDKVWEKSQDIQKNIIMSELAAAGEGLRGTKAGKLIYTKLKVNLYTRNKKEWLETVGKENKKKALLAEFL